MRQYYGYKKPRIVEEHVSITASVLDLLETYYPEKLSTAIVIARLQDIHPEWSVESIRRILARGLKGKAELFPGGPGTENYWRALGASWEVA